MSKLNIAILGAGHIAGKMAKTLSFLRDIVNPYAIASRDISRAERMTSENGFAKAYGSYEDMLSDPAVDVVYIATPNNLHHAQALACVEHGKHVICEKPFTLRAEEAEKIFNAAKARGLFVLEAMWPRFQPVARIIHEIIDSGEIGAPRYLQATFGLAIAGKERVIRPELGGGALLDLGIYPLNFAAMHFGLPEDDGCVSSSATLTASGVDDQSTITLTYSDGRMASLSTSITAAMGAYGRISGTLGTIEIPQLTRCESLIVRKIPSNEEHTITCPFDYNGYEYEIRAAAKAIGNGLCECSEMPWSETLRIVRLMENLRREWGCQF